jgi:membrane-associated protein
MSVFSVESIIRGGGIAIVGAIVFAESGLLIGFFLPGDSLLFTAGFLASQDLLNIHVLAAVCFIAAVAGDSVGYHFGKRMGPRLVKKEDSWLFKREYIAQAEAFFEKHGRKTIVLARFTPIVRTFAPIVAGIGSMNYRTFLTYNVVGGALWAVGLTYLGYYLGRSIPWISEYLELGIIAIVMISLLPTMIHLLSNAENRERIKKLPAVTLRRIRSIIRRSESE